MLFSLSRMLPYTNEQRQELERANTRQKQELDRLKTFIVDELNELKNNNNLNQDLLTHIIRYIEKINSVDDFYFLSAVEQIISSWNKDQNLHIEFEELANFIGNRKHINETYLNYFSKFVNANAKQLLDEIKNFRELNDIYKNHKTYEIYQKAEKVNGDKYNFYIYFAILFVVIGLPFSIFSKIIFTQCFFGKLCILEYNNIDYWIMKASIIFITITGVTFCLKQAIHHQKKKDKAEQTRLELEALPTYMFNFSDEQKNEVYKELTGKYFGRDFDNEGYKDMANLIQEQIRLSHEVLKDTLLKNSNATSTKKVS